ncbi:TPA: transcriptional repressor, partial [Enterococcus faecium]|nr:transcriptional repressor [Enterococcus faecium]
MENKLVEEVIEKLKKENIRITPQRYAVLEYL